MEVATGIAYAARTRAEHLPQGHELLFQPGGDAAWANVWECLTAVGVVATPQAVPPVPGPAAPAASAVSVASVQPVPKLLARQAIRVQPVPKHYDIFGAPGVRGVLGAASKARPRAKLLARQAIRVSEEHMEESAPSVVSAESMEPVASEERMEEGRRRDEGRMGGDERGKKEEMPPASLPPTAAAPPPQPPSGGLLLQVLGARTGNSLQAAPAREGKAPSAASAASARPRAKLLVRQAIRVKPVPKKIFLKRGKPKDRQC